MQDSLSELAQKYRDEMLRMYSTRPESPSKPSRPEPPPKPSKPEPPPKPSRPEPPPKPSRPEPPPKPSRPEPPPKPSRPEPPPKPSRPEPPPKPSRPIYTKLPIRQPRSTSLPEDSQVVAVMSQLTEPDASEANEESAPEFELEPESDIIYEDPVLPEYIQPVTPVLPSEWDAQEAYEQHNSAEGKLYVVASTADSAYPVPNARVTIYSQIDGKAKLNYLLTTDESGLTPVVTLPAPPAALSQQPEHVKPYATYNIKIYAGGYFREEAKQVPIFAGITSRQVFQMIPLPLAVSEDVETIQLPPPDESV